MCKGSGPHGQKSQSLSDKARRKILEKIRSGFTDGAACGLANVLASRFEFTLDNDEKFKKRVELARALARARIEKMVLDKINEGDAKMAIDFLKRRDPENWAGQVRYETSQQSLNVRQGIDHETVEIEIGPDPYQDTG